MERRSGGTRAVASADVPHCPASVPPISGSLLSARSCLEAALACPQGPRPTSGPSPHGATDRRSCSSRYNPCFLAQPSILGQSSVRARSQMWFDGNSTLPRV